MYTKHCAYLIFKYDWNKQLIHFIKIIVDKADKMAEIEKNERQIQQQQERDDEMREMALRLRRR